MRCNETKQLEVHHKHRDQGNSIDNAQVLCQHCHEKTETYGVQGESPKPFSDETKKEALKKAGERCECEIEDCHDNIDNFDNIDVPLYPPLRNNQIRK